MTKADAIRIVVAEVRFQHRCTESANTSQTPCYCTYAGATHSDSCRALNAALHRLDPAKKAHWTAIFDVMGKLKNPGVKKTRRR